MKQIIILIISLLCVNCSILKHPHNKEESVELSVFNIKENLFSYVLETVNTSFDTTLLVVSRNDFDKLKNVIIEDKTFTFHVVKIKYRVPHMEILLQAIHPCIVFETDTIYKCKCVDTKFCPDVYMFNGLKE